MTLAYANVIVVCRHCDWTDTGIRYPFRLGPWRLGTGERIVARLIDTPDTDDERKGEELVMGIGEQIDHGTQYTIDLDSNT